MTAAASRPIRQRRRDRVLLGSPEGFLVESPGGRVGVLVDVRSTGAGRQRHVDAIVVSAGLSEVRVLIIPVSEISGVGSRTRQVQLCASPTIAGTERAHMGQSK